MIVYKKLGKTVPVTLLLTLIFLALAACGKKSEILVLELDDNPASGFEWEIYQADPIFKEEHSYKEKSNKA